MKFSVNWLREMIDIPDRLDDLVDLLTMAGVEIEGVTTAGANIDKVIVGQIRESSQHPNADRLTVCRVDDGSGIDRQIICGARNYKPGDKVPLALPGAELPNGARIKASKLRGIESEGMLCSARELNLGDDASGLLILTTDVKPGAPLADVYPGDTILDVEITPNRGDLLSHHGLAREIAALSHSAVRSPIPEAFDRAPGTERRGIAIAALAECPFYSARRIENVWVGPSPDWLRARIESAGIRSINNIVDISNFVMLELGQPTHAFDADKLKGEVEVRLARERETFLALDGKRYTLNNDNLVIADQERAIGIGGVMGGEETGVTASTRNVLLESAYFLPASVRRTARTLNLPSDASYRFERGVDPGMILPASHRAAELIQRIAAGTAAPNVFVAGEPPPNPADVSLRYDKCQDLLGVAIDGAQVDEVLASFGLAKRGDHPPTWAIPSHRRDLARDVDLIEEVVRAYGVQRISGTNRSRFSAFTAADQSHDRESELRQRLSARGLDEARTSKLMPPHGLGFSDGIIKVRNPLNEDHVALRPDLLNGLLAVLDRNIRSGAEHVAIFELGRVFVPPHGSEERHLGMLLWGNNAESRHWRPGSTRQFDFTDLKGVVDSITAAEISFHPISDPHFLLAAQINLKGEPLGYLGQLAGGVMPELKDAGPVWISELNAEPLMITNQMMRRFQEMHRFPAIKRDIAMIVPERLTHAEVMRSIGAVSEPLLQTVELFDLFSGKQNSAIGAGRKSLAYTLTYRDRNRTLTTDEVTAAHARIRERLQSELGAELRE